MHYIIPIADILDNVKLDEITELNISASYDSGNIDEGENTSVNKENYLNTELKNNSTYFAIHTKSIPVRENRIYNYTITTDSENVSSYSGMALFKNSKDVVQNFTKYGNNASNGGVLSLSAGSEISTDLNVIESANYTIAVRAKTCQSCTFLRVEIAGGDNDKNKNDLIQISNVPLNDKSPGLHWKYTNSTYLKQGKYALRIFSNSQEDIDSVVIYTDDNKGVYTNPNNGENKKLDLFNLYKNLSQTYISDYKKINPTKHIINIKNATTPYVIVFAESYDPLWTAHAQTGVQNNSVPMSKNNNFKVNSIPLYGVVNGFYVHKTGDYTLVIEYEPQKWFVQGALISTVSIVLISVGIYLFVKRKIMAKLLKI